MRHAIGRFRGLDKEFAHAPDIIPGHVVSLCAHQFCRVEIHAQCLLAGLRFVRTAFVSNSSGNKKPAHRKTSAAGKYLTQMDLPLAASEPSPPDCSRSGLRLARHHLDTLPMDHFLAALPPGQTRARFEFAARTHRERNHSDASKSREQPIVK